VIVRLEEIAGVLAELFGPEVAADSRVAQAVAAPMRSWVPRQVPLEVLTETLQDALCGALLEATGGTLWYRRGDALARVSTQALSRAADALLGLLFDRLPESQPNYELVRDWAQGTGSLSALRCLSRDRFAAYRPAGEQQFMQWAYENRLREEAFPE
jgi:hypothetical protein